MAFSPVLFRQQKYNIDDEKLSTTNRYVLPMRLNKSVPRTCYGPSRAAEDHWFSIRLLMLNVFVAAFDYIFYLFTQVRPSRQVLDSPFAVDFFCCPT